MRRLAAALATSFIAGFELFFATSLIFLDADFFAIFFMVLFADAFFTVCFFAAVFFFAFFIMAEAS
jgi:hypothetical protein